MGHLSAGLAKGYITCQRRWVVRTKGGLDLSAASMRLRRDGSHARHYPHVAPWPRLPPSNDRDESEGGDLGGDFR